jgi:hypothetical protein
MQRRVIIFMSFVLALSCLGFSASAENYEFDDIYASLSLPSDVYNNVITKDNAANNEDTLKSLGYEVESFNTGGMLLIASDKKNDRLLTLSAVKDGEAEQYFNINEHTPQTRASYRRLHSASDRFKVLGYHYNSVEWKNFKKSGRWLMLRYNFRQGGSVEHRGYQRRTIYNGYTITMDMKVLGGRQLKSADNKALNKVFDTLTFTQTLPLPQLPVSFDEQVTAPSETAEDTFTMKGKTAAGAKLTAVIGSFSTAETKVFEGTASKNGSYSLTITLPREDLYFMTLTVEVEGALPLEKQYAVTYRKGLINVAINNSPPEKLEADSYTISGTAEKGVSVSLSVNGELSTKRIGAGGKFSFKIDTKNEGKYDIILKFSKENYEDRSFTYNCERTLSDEERVSRIKSSAKSPAYSTLMRNIDNNDGKMLRYEGYIISSEEKAGEWILKFATAKTGETYKNLIILSSDKQVGYPLNTKLTAYGVLVGTSSMLNENNQEVECPKLQLMHIE